GPERVVEIPVKTSPGTHKAKACIQEPADVYDAYKGSPAKIIRTQAGVINNPFKKINPIFGKGAKRSYFFSGGISENHIRKAAINRIIDVPECSICDALEKSNTAGI